MQRVDCPDDFKLTIQFNRKECEAFYTVAQRVGGPIGCGKGHQAFEDLLRILRDAGIKREIPLDDENCRRGTIYFAE